MTFTTTNPTEALISGYVNNTAPVYPALQYTPQVQQQTKNLGPTNIQSTGSNTAQLTAEDLAYLRDQASQLQSLLGRTQTNLDQGLTKNQQEYDTQVGGATQSKESQVRDQNKAKLSAYGQINKNANSGYRSLAQIIGRSAGTGSSAFKDALLNAVGTDTSSRRFEATGTYDTNLGKIDTSFQNVLADLARQKKDNEDKLRTAVETQRQDLNSKLAQNAGQQASVQGLGYAGIRAAQAPFQSAIENSRNAVEGFFNQFNTPYTPQAVAPEVNPYNTDRAAINADQQGGNASNPYEAILRKKLQGQA